MRKQTKARKIHYNVDRQLLSEEDILLWLFRRYIKVGTESEVIAAQDEALQSIYHEKNIEIQTCRNYDEALDYDMSAYPVLAKEQ